MAESMCGTVFETVHSNQPEGSRFPIYVAVVHEHVYESCTYITGIVQLNGFALID